MAQTSAPLLFVILNAFDTSPTLRCSTTLATSAGSCDIWNLEVTSPVSMSV